jgi:AcrR family transcriptional regulator
MPPIKERTKNLTQDRILNAAAELFARQGFAESSTFQIARLAGVNEVTVFRHFSRKKTLFWAATESRLRHLSITQELLNRLEADESPRTALHGIVEFVVKIAQDHPDTLRLLYLALFTLDERAEKVLRKHLLPLLEPIRAYLCRCASKGLIRDLDPELATLGLASLVSAHIGLQSVLTRNDEIPASSDEAIAAYTNFWMTAMLQAPALGVLRDG